MTDLMSVEKWAVPVVDTWDYLYAAIRPAVVDGPQAARVGEVVMGLSALGVFIAIVSMLTLSVFAQLMTVHAVLAGAVSGLFVRGRIAGLVGGIGALALFALWYGEVFIAAGVEERIWSASMFMITTPIFLAGLIWAAVVGAVKAKVLNTGEVAP